MKQSLSQEEFHGFYETGIYISEYLVRLIVLTGASRFTFTLSYHWHLPQEPNDAFCVALPVVRSLIGFV
jgi:hypothetical protein